MSKPSEPFSSRVRALPALGLGVSTEYGAHSAPGGLDLVALRTRFPQYGRFLEVGVETSVGLDQPARDWVAAGGATTYHFLDVNLDEPEDFDAAWLAEVSRTVEALRPAWLCGDAGRWHIGRRERGHMLLLPPVLTASAAEAMVPGIVTLRSHTGLEVLPENPPGVVYPGELHLLDFFARVCEGADTGMLLDAAHLAIFQRTRGLDPLAGFADFPLDRIVEMHVAGGTVHSKSDFSWVEDDHRAAILPDTWRIVEAVVQRAPNLKAIVLECERNRLHDMLPIMGRLERLFQGARVKTPVGGAYVGRPRAPLSAAEARELGHAVIERLMAPDAQPAAVFPAVRDALSAEPAAAFSTDPLRPTRLLGAMTEEFPVSIAALGVHTLPGFFRTDAWRGVVRNRGSLAAGFAEWLFERVGPVARLEGALAQARRAGAATPAEAKGSLLRLAPGAQLLQLPQGCFTHWQSLHNAHGGALADAVARGLQAPMPNADQPGEWVLVHAGASAAEALPDALGELLQACGAGLPRAAVVAEAIALGAEHEEALELVDGLVESGILGA